MSRRVFVTGASGQIGSNLIQQLVKSNQQVIASDLTQPTFKNTIKNLPVNVLEKDVLQQAVSENDVDVIYHLAAILSAKGEKNPQQAWDVNMKGLLNILDVAKECNCKVFWPSSIAVFGSESQRQFTPQNTVMQPETVYGISKVAGELWCKYYFDKFGVDTRSVRFPGLISWKGEPGGGTTDYANEIYFSAVRNENYTCFLKDDAYLPMLYMDDAIRGIIELMNAPAEQISVKTSYNLSGMSFSPKDVWKEIQNYYPDFQINYDIDFRQQIAESWPASVDDQLARDDWGWQPEFDLQDMTKEMISKLKNRL